MSINLFPRQDERGQERAEEETARAHVPSLLPYRYPESPDLASTALELEALQAIYGEEAFRLHDPTEYSEQAGEGRIRYEAILP